MDASVDPVMSDDKTGAIPVSPVQIDLAVLARPRIPRAERVRYVAILALCLGLHAALLLLLEDRPQGTQVEEAIPVEVIVEPPPENKPQDEARQEPEKAEEKAETPAQTIDEPPATDFARSAEQDVEDGKASEQAAAPTSEPEQPSPQPSTTVEPAPPAEPLVDIAADIAPAPEAVAPAPPPEAAPKTPPPPQPKTATRFAGLTPLPDFEFKAPLAKRTDGPKGKAQPGYLSALYSQIMRKMPSLPKPTRPARGRVTFGVMGNGQIFQETIAIASGAPVLDAAALGAVRRAAPYPPPPNGGPVYIRFDYGSD